MNILYTKEINTNSDKNTTDFGFIIKRTHNDKLMCKMLPIEKVGGLLLRGFTESPMFPGLNIPVYCEHNVAEVFYQLKYDICDNDGNIRMSFHSPISFTIGKDRYYGFDVQQDFHKTKTNAKYDTYIINISSDSSIRKWREDNEDIITKV